MPPPPPKRVLVLAHAGDFVTGLAAWHPRRRALCPLRTRRRSRVSPSSTQRSASPPDASRNARRAALSCAWVRCYRVASHPPRPPATPYQLPPDAPRARDVPGKLCIEVSSKDKIAFLSEELCIGCGICVKVWSSPRSSAQTQPHATLQRANAAPRTQPHATLQRANAAPRHAPADKRSPTPRSSGQTQPHATLQRTNAAPRHAPADKRSPTPPRAATERRCRPPPRRLRNAPSTRSRSSTCPRTSARTRRTATRPTRSSCTGCRRRAPTRSSGSSGGTASASRRRSRSWRAR